MFKSDSVIIFLLTIATGLFVLTFISPIFLPIETAKIMSEMFYNVGLGFGAFIAALAGYKKIEEILSETRIKRKIEDYKSEYPPTEHLKKWMLIVSKSDRGKVFLHDKENNLRRWVSSYSTFLDLDFAGLHREKVDAREFLKIPQGKDIHTRGAKGS